MRKAIIFAITLACTSNVYAKGNTWGYSGDIGPEKWASLTADNFACTGTNQSPVNLTGFNEADLVPIEMDYQQGGYEIVNNDCSA